MNRCQIWILYLETFPYVIIFFCIKKCQILILFAILCAPVRKRGDSRVRIRVGTLIACYSLDSLQNVIFVFFII